MRQSFASSPVKGLEDSLHIESNYMSHDLPDRWWIVLHLKCYTIPVSPASQLPLILVAANISHLEFFAMDL